VKQFWNILAGVFAGVALVLLLRHDYDKAFISAALGAVAWFLSYRVQMRELIKDNESTEGLNESFESNEEE
jgi:hypothetical protein